MGSRETYTTKIRCGDCGATGQGRFTENANPVYTRGALDRVTNEISDGFRMGGSGPLGIQCESCGSSNVDQS